jgi:hypothetical protein
MGTTHMLGGAAAWLGVCAFTTPAPFVTAAGAGLALAGALAPDVDHRKSDAADFARSAGMAVVLFAAVTLSTAAPARGQPVLLAGAGVALACLPRMTRPHAGHGFRGVVHSLWGLAAMVMLATVPVALTAWPWWAGLAIVTGWCSHLVLDAFTIEGLPLAWPVRRRFGWLNEAHSVRTGGKRARRGDRRHTGREYTLVQPLLTIMLVMAAAGCVIGGAV